MRFLVNKINEDILTVNAYVHLDEIGDGAKDLQMEATTIEFNNKRELDFVESAYTTSKVCSSNFKRLVKPLLTMATLSKKELLREGYHEFKVVEVFYKRDISEKAVNDIMNKIVSINKSLDTYIDGVIAVSFELPSLYKDLNTFGSIKSLAKNTRSRVTRITSNIEELIINKVQPEETDKVVMLNGDLIHTCDYRRKLSIRVIEGDEKEALKTYYKQYYDIDVRTSEYWVINCDEETIQQYTIGKRKNDETRKGLNTHKTLCKTNTSEQLSSNIIKSTLIPSIELNLRDIFKR